MPKNHLELMSSIGDEVEIDESISLHEMAHGKSAPEAQPRARPGCYSSKEYMYTVHALAEKAVSEARRQLKPS